MLKVRVKFSKMGAMKFIGHLDIMRYFQKAVRRAQIDVAYSEGYSPHMIMSFAAPLGVGLTSQGEYFDMEIRTPIASAEAVRRLNAVMAEGIEVLSFRKVDDGKASKAMSLVSAADYAVSFREGMEPDVSWKDKILEFTHQEAIVVWKKTKKSEREIDIKPYIYEMHLKEDKLFFKLAAGSVNNTKPELVMEAFLSYAGVTLEEYSLLVHRLEVYADLGEEGQRRLVSLEDLGEEIE